MYNVLLVDDEPIIKVALRAIIPWEAHGCQIAATASNGAEALRCISGTAVDIVITDLKMPQMDGIALIRALKAANFAGAILVLSNYADFELAREALVTGALDYMLKVDIESDVLIRQLERAKEYIEQHRRTQSRIDRAAQSRSIVRRALSDYLRGEAELPGEALDIDGPYWMFMLLFPPGRQDARPLMTRVEDILRGVFEESPDLHVEISGERAVACVGTVRSLGEARIAHKIDQVRRQVSVFLGAAFTALVPEAVGDLSRIRELYECCLGAAEFANLKPEVCSALLHIHLHYRTHLSLDAVAAASGLEKSYLCRLFKRETGMHIFQYINRYRMEKAARLLQRGNIYVKDVAPAVGIEDPFYFTRLFKKHYGVNPAEYRKRR